MAITDKNAWCRYSGNLWVKLISLKAVSKQNLKIKPRRNWNKLPSSPSAIILAKISLTITYHSYYYILTSNLVQYLSSVADKWIKSHINALKNTQNHLAKTQQCSKYTEKILPTVIFWTLFTVQHKYVT